ncbi:MAG: DNA-binding protein [Clostridia bacterium]|nr:DNA-binding protein [Clostridia bacterium]
MFEKNLQIAFLLDFYGDVLSEHDRTILELYYAEDLSLAEIADSIGISRQGVRHIIKKGEENLLFWEERLHLANRYKRMKEAAEKLLSLTDALEEGEDAVALAKEMRSCANTILENNQA